MDSQIGKYFSPIIRVPNKDLTAAASVPLGFEVINEIAKTDRATSYAIFSLLTHDKNFNTSEEAPEYYADKQCLDQQFKLSFFYCK